MKPVEDIEKTKEKGSFILLKEAVEKRDFAKCWFPCAPQEVPSGCSSVGTRKVPHHQGLRNYAFPRGTVGTSYFHISGLNRQPPKGGSAVLTQGTISILFLLILIPLLFSCDAPQKPSTTPSTSVNSITTPISSTRPTARHSIAKPKVPLKNTKLRIVFLTAPWCQWCKVMKHEVLSRKDVKEEIAKAYELRYANVDDEPTWMDLPGVQGLPTMVFFDAENRHVLSKSGYQSAGILKDYLKVVAKKIQSKELPPYPKTVISILSDETLSSKEAERILSSYESQLFIAVNSNHGGFNSPAAHPRPKLLWELQRWIDVGGVPERVDKWLALTVKNAMRGSSPNLVGNPLPDMDFTINDLQNASKQGHAYSKWLEGIETLPDKDPYLGIRDLDGLFFRYASGPGWYHPHFERLADENLAWILLLNRRNLSKESAKNWRTFKKIFRYSKTKKKWFNRAQDSDPFYYRLPKKERIIPPPKVHPNPNLEVQAWTLRIQKTQCDVFQEFKNWPPMRLDRPNSKASIDTVGELLISLSLCPELKEYQQTLSVFAVERWKKGLPKDARLHRLAAGICAAHHPSCGAALKEASAVELDVKFAPPVVALAKYIQR